MEAKFGQLKRKSRASTKNKNFYNVENKRVEDKITELRFLNNLNTKFYRTEINAMSLKEMYGNGTVLHKPRLMMHSLCIW
jgi:hypothetical protein